MDFKVTEDHVKLLRRASIVWENGEYGAPGMDCKRPYGNGDVEHDIAEILGWDIFEDAYGEHALSFEQEDLARQLHQEMETVLQILVTNPIGLQGTWKRVDGQWQILF